MSAFNRDDDQNHWNAKKKSSHEKRQMQLMAHSDCSDEDERLGAVGGVRQRPHDERQNRGGMQMSENQFEFYNRRGQQNSNSKNNRDRQCNSGRFIDRERTHQRIKKKGLGFFRSLIQEEPSKIVLALGLKDNGFQELVNSPVMKPEMIKVLLTLLKKSCLCESAPEKLNEILSCLPNSPFFNMHVQSFIIGMTKEESVHKQDECKQSLKDFLTVLYEMGYRMPSSFIAVRGASAMVKMTIEDLQDNSNIVDNEILEKLKFIDSGKDMMYKKLQKETQKRAPDYKYENQPPPDNFRDISVFPVDRDIHSDEQPYIRCNKISGRYDDLDNYLDVQFRLLREDFIAPLRKGIAEYLVEGDDEIGRRRNKITDIRVYDDVKIICPVCSHTNLTYRLSFDISRLKYIKWAISKRLIYGSLLCLSSDNFKTFMFASVAERKTDDLHQGLVNVKFENSEINIMEFGADTRFIMAETTAYFEAYRHVLTGLQNLRAGDLPFECHIVDCDTDIRSPAYLRQGGNEPTYDLRPLIDRRVVLKDHSLFINEEQDQQAVYTFSAESQNAKSVKILNKNSWPSPEDLHLDESQYTAIQTALTSQFVITQGPPGTGKTYIGLQIVRALLHNKNVWSVNQNGVKEHKPLLIVCYTNHALDQFLEELSDFYMGDILRVGGRSSSEKLKQFNLREIRRKVRQNRSVPREIFRAKIAALNEMNTLKDTMDRLSLKIEAAEREIMHENLLKHFIGPLKFNSLVNVQFYGDGDVLYAPSSFMVEWLELGQISFIMENQYTEECLHQHNAHMNEDGLIEVFDEIGALENQRHIEDNDDGLSDHEELEFDSHTDFHLDDITTDILDKDIRKCIAFKVSHLDRKPHQNEYDFDPRGWQIQTKARKKLKRKILKELRNLNRMGAEEASRICDVWTLSLLDRWRLYKFWVHNMCEHVRSDLSGRAAKYQAAADRYREVLIQEDKEIMRRSTVVGMTTTCAARYQAVLNEIGPKIIVVEEAAEVLEAHVITTLSRGCQHLILIGDHKQLKPNPTVYKLAKDFNLEISLFERMIKNGLRCDCLQLQHRMRPQISSIMRHIYPRLIDHESVQNYEPIRGIGNNMFFISHTELEDYDQDNKSHSNLHEAKYVVALCKYLILQGYSKSQITVLTPYSGQLFQLRKLMPKSFFDGVRVTVVDNFQGEENDIILLSLVRSNDEGNVGFLKIENRICVALSRAKKGLYVVGNFSLLEDISDLWRDIVVDLKKRRSLGAALPLHCQNHPDHHFSAESAEDFNKAPEGGCLKPCGFRLQCGHCCPKPCHIIDREHTDYECQKPCEKTVCENGHKCNRRCYQDCGNCEILVPKVINLCGHTQQMPCYIRPNNFKCHAQCGKQLECGHVCTNECGQKCTVFCNVPIRKVWPCGHAGEVSCHKKKDEPCTHKCTFKLECEHSCVGTCGECFQGRLHKSCEKTCNRVLVCNHQCKDYCSNCPPCTLPCGNHCEHSYCSKLCGELCSPCLEKCNWQCDHYRCTKLCWEDCDRPRCDKPCMKFLQCGHKCAGVCGEPCPSLCKECDPEIREVFLGNEDEEDALFVQLEDCGHTFTTEDLDYYMDLRGEETLTIQMKTCPRCTIPILRNLRYCNIIKKMLSEIEAVKRKAVDPEGQIPILQVTVKEEKRELAVEDRRDIEKYEDTRDFVRTEKSLTALINVIRFLKEIRTIQSNMSYLENNTNSPVMYTDIQKLVQNLRTWLLKVRNIMTDQECSDAQNEINRISKMVKICIAAVEISRLVPTDKAKLCSAVDLAIQHLQASPPLDAEKNKTIDDLIINLEPYIPKNTGFTDAERVMIVKAMGLSKGHWFKCPKGHIYAIGDCGGATVESKCPECKSTIGGTSHRLRQDNTLAADFDGAVRAAWPTAIDI